MNNTIKILGVIGIIAILIVVIAVYTISISTLKEVAEGKLGAVMGIPYSYFGATFSSSTITAATPVAILSKDANRTNATICSLNSYAIFLYPTSTAGTGGITVNTGILLPGNASSTTPCRDFPGLKGYLYGLAATGTAAVSITEIK